MIVDRSTRKQAESSAAQTSAGGRQPARKLLSGDGAWWWNGRRWILAVTEDGLWRWDGSRWRATTDLDGKRPEELSAALSRLAEDSYVRAGAILAERAEEWDPDEERRGLVERAQETARRLKGLEESLSGSDSSRGGILGRRPSPSGGRQHLEEEQRGLTAQYRSLMLELGRAAPQPSIKEADDVLASAVLLEQWSTRLRDALSEVDEAERMRADSTVALQNELASTEERRLRTIQEASRAVDLARAAHSRAVSEARARLRAALTPGPGELKGGLGLLRLHANLLETPAGRLPAAGLTIFVDTAAALWRHHRDRLSDLLAVAAPDTETFLTALTERKETLFLLIIGTTGTVLWACPDGQETQARHFAALIANHGRERAANPDDEAAASREKELDQLVRDRSSIETAEAELERVEGDPSLLGAIDEARRRLEQARADTPELIAARRKVMELARRLATAPEPLRPAEPLPERAGARGAS